MTEDEFNALPEKVKNLLLDLQRAFYNINKKTEDAPKKFLFQLESPGLPQQDLARAELAKAVGLRSFEELTSANNVHEFITVGGVVYLAAAIVPLKKHQHHGHQ